MAANVSAAVNVANFVIGQTVNANSESDSAMSARFKKLSGENAVVHSLIDERIVSNSPMVTCLNETAGKGANACPAGIAYVFFQRQSIGKSSAIRYFCQKSLRSNKVRSLVISGGSPGESYFQRMAADLQVDFTSNWARCLVSAMTKAPQEAFNPFVFLDEFNDGTVRDLQELNLFMRACQNKGFYLIVVTSKQRIADDVIELNAWGKVRPLKCVHKGPITNIRGQPGYQENKTADWQEIDWTVDQLKNLVITKTGELPNYDFILAGMTPTDALTTTQEIKDRQPQSGI